MGTGNDSLRKHEEDGKLAEDFVERLNRTLERHDVDTCWHSEQRHQFLSELVKWAWYLGGLFSRIDLFGGRQEDPTNKHYKRWQHHANFDPKFTKCRLVWWPYVSLPLYIFSSLRLALNIYYQYVYDYNFLRQQVFRALTSHTNHSDVSNMLKSHINSQFVQKILAVQERDLAAQGEQDKATSDSINLNLRTGNNYQQEQMNLSQFGSLLDERVADSYAALKRIGAPYYMFTFELQIVYFFLILSSFVVVIVIKLYYSHARPFDFYLVRAFLDFKQERRLFNYLIVDELNRFISSSRNFTLACVKQTHWFASSAPDTTNQHEKFSYNRLSIETAHARTEANRFLLNHVLIKRQLEHMALGGQLLPEHRTARWVDSISLKFIAFSIVTMGYIYLATLFFAFIIFAVIDTVHIDTVSYLDVMTICEAGVLVVLMVPMSVFHIAVMVATSIDQICYSKGVCRRIRECIQVNQGRFNEICEMHKDGQHQRRPWIRSTRAPRSPPLMSNLQQHGGEQKSSDPLRYNGQVYLNDDSNTISRHVSNMPSPTESPWPSSGSSVASGLDQPISSSDRFRPLPIEWLARARWCPTRWLTSTSRTHGLDNNEITEKGEEEVNEREKESGHDLFQSIGDVTTNDIERQTLDRPLSIESRCTQMNADLLRAFITYKIFVAQMRQTTLAFVTFTLACISVIIVSPIQVRIHSPYFGQLTKITAVGFSFVATTAVDACLILLCYMFARCTEIYRCLSSLLAHTVEVMNYAPAVPSSQVQSLQTSELGPGGVDANLLASLESCVVSSSKTHMRIPEIYDTHTIWLLRKELNFPDRVVGQFAIVALDIRLTYSNLLKIHFWMGLLSLSIFVDDSSTQEFFGRLFNDPFGVFNWP